MNHPIKRLYRKTMKSVVIRIRTTNFEKLEELAIKESMKRGVQITPSQLVDEILEKALHNHVDLDRETFSFAESISDNKNKPS
jgi:hypothetical protein